MTKSVYPNANIAEVTLIGTGGGYGESCVIHLGDDEWIVVDSCINPESKTSLPLNYLRELGVNTEKNVKLIVCTHWHDDHILGLSELLNECTNAKFCMSNVKDLKKFLQFVTLDYKKVKDNTSNSSTREFGRCIDIIRDRKSDLLLAVKDRCIYNNGKSQLYSLSPSDFAILNFDFEISALISEYGPPNKKVISQSPNDKSVVLYIKIGAHRVLLGADLEVSSNEKTGWLDICSTTTVVDQKSSLYKISHHGSKNGFHQNIWAKLVEKNTISALTPWNKNNKLPQIDMLKIYCQLSGSVYMTSPVLSEKPKKRDRSTEKIITSFNKKLREIKFDQGIIRFRIENVNPNSQWNIDLFGSAFHVNPLTAV
jgi:beta-lactamase superfamily II metal-dependent hydrolase